MTWSLGRVTTDVPGMVIEAVDYVSHGVEVYCRVLPPSTSAWFNLTAREDQYNVKITFVDNEGRTALIYMGLFDGSVLFTGNIEDGSVFLPHNENTAAEDARRSFDLHLKQDGTLYVLAAQNVRWVVEEEEVDEIIVEIPAFKRSMYPPEYTQ